MQLPTAGKIRISTQIDKYLLPCAFVSSVSIMSFIIALDTSQVRHLSADFELGRLHVVGKMKQAVGWISHDQRLVQTYSNPESLERSLIICSSVFVYYGLIGLLILLENAAIVIHLDF